MLTDSKSVHGSSSLSLPANPTRRVMLDDTTEPNDIVELLRAAATLGWKSFGWSISPDRIELLLAFDSDVQKRLECLEGLIGIFEQATSAGYETYITYAC